MSNKHTQLERLGKLLPKKWTEDDCLVMTRHYPNTPTASIAVLLDRSIDAIFVQARKMGVKKDPKFISATKSINGKSQKGGQFVARHGMAHPGNATYNTWAGMKARCLNKQHKSYKHYGGRGVTICAEWINDFSQFLADMGEKPDGLTIGRIDNNGIYEKSNCQWETMKEQQNNRRTNRILEAFGDAKTVSQWCDEFPITPDTLSKRIDIHGWSIEEAISTPVGSRTRWSNQKTQVLIKDFSMFQEGTTKAKTANCSSN